MITYGNDAPDAPLVLLYGNCQTTYLAMLLAAANGPSGEYAYACVLNHAIPGQQQVMPSEHDFARCVLYLEQYDSEKLMAIRETARRSLPAGCPRLVFPTFMMFCLWPFESHDPRQVSEPDFIWGRYPHGDSLGIEVAHRGLAGEAAAEAYMQLFQARMPDAQSLLRKDLERIARHDNASDVRIGDYVIANFRRTHLFWTTGHVSSAAITELALRLHAAVLPILGGDLRQGQSRIRECGTHFSGMGEQQLPVHPQLARDLGLEYCDENTRFSWFGHHWTFREYIARYITYDRSWQPGGGHIGNPTEPVHLAFAAKDIHQADMQLVAARHLRWMPDRVSIGNTHVTFEGWALNTWEDPLAMRFLVNGKDAHDLEWPIASPAMLAPFGQIPNAQAARFRCRHTRQPGDDLFPDGFMRLNVTGRFGEHRLSYRNAWFICDPQQENALPPAQALEQAVGSQDQAIYQLGGATLVKRVEQFLLERFERPLSDFSGILDWRCGHGQRSRYLSQLSDSVTGVDDDPNAIQFCMQNIGNVRFQLTGAQPPLPFPEDSFDLVIGTGTLPPLTTSGNNWLAELQRIVRPGGLVLLGIPGMSQAVLQQASVPWLQNVQREGCLYLGTNPHTQLPSPLPEHAITTSQSHDYVKTRWGLYFDVLDIVEAVANIQDLVLMRKRTPDGSSAPGESP